MGNRQKRRAKLQDRITERKAEAIAFPSKYAQKTQPAAKPTRKLSRPALVAIVVIGAFAIGMPAYIYFAGGHSVSSVASHVPFRMGK